MKRLSLTIRARVTLWYTLLTAVIMLLALWALLRGTARAADYYMENLLVEAVSAASEETRWEAAAPKLNLADVPDFDDKVSFVLLDDEGGLWQGHWPPFSAPFADGAVRRMRDASGREYVVQDLLLELAGGSVWLRGYLRADSARFYQSEARTIAFYALPALLALAAMGGYLLTMRAFRPVSRMARAAEGVAEGGDLSRRFDARGRDEIAALSRTFNGMFERLQAAFDREKRFTDDAAHELRTPVAVISAACEQALAACDPADMREALEIIQDKAGRMGDILSQLLALARMDAGRARLMPEKLNAGDILRDVAREMAGAAREKGVEIDAEGDAVLWGDELLLTRLAIILTDNAVKFSLPGGTVALRAEERGENVLLTVRDTGAGMRAEDAARAFERFYQADGARTPGGGAGLGLPMAKAIALLHGGDIALQSEYGQGTCVAVTLPVNEKNLQKE